MATPKRGPRYPVTKDGKILLKKMARLKGVTTKQMAKHCKVSHAAISQLLSLGERSVWSSHVVKELCKYLDISIWAVVEGLEADDRASPGACSRCSARPLPRLHLARHHRASARHRLGPWVGCFARTWATTIFLGC